MFDLIIRGGQLVSPVGIERAHLGISNGRIAAVVGLGESITGAAEIDAAQRLVLPGLVDAHVHLREPGLVHKEGFETGTKAAAAGGVTTVMVMPTDDPWTATPEEFERKRALTEGKIHVDVALQAALGPHHHDVQKLADLGAISFEIFLAGGTPDFLVERDADLIRLLESTRAAGAVAGITPGSQTMIAQLTQEQKASQTPTIRAFAAARPARSEAFGVARACRLAKEVGARVHLRQISCAASVEELERGSDRQYVSSEVTPHNLLLTEEDADRLGPFGVVIPPLRSEADASAVRDALRRGTIDIAATDHAPHLPAEKERGRDNIWKAASGLPGLQTFAATMFELVERDVLSISDLVRVCSERPARLFGLFPRKGSLARGADADLILVDPNGSTEIRNEDQYSKAVVTPFAGRRCRGRVELVLLRGKVIAREGKVEGVPTGQFVCPANRGR